MDKVVPLVVYKDGERIVIGRTTIHECDGALTFVAEVDDSELARSLLPPIHMNEFSVRRPVLIDEWANSDIQKRRFEDG